MRKRKSTRRIFHFDSGTHIEVRFHLGKNCWMATRENPPEWAETRGFGGTPLLAVRDLRKELARKVRSRINPGYEVILDEGTKDETVIWQSVDWRQKGWVKL